MQEPAASLKTPPCLRLRRRLGFQPPLPRWRPRSPPAAAAAWRRCQLEAVRPGQVQQGHLGPTGRAAGDRNVVAAVLQSAVCKYPETPGVHIPELLPPKESPCTLR